MANTKYRVYADDNSHFMDESERYCAGIDDTDEEVIAKCKKIVERSIEESAANINNARDLLSSYKMYGEDPFNVGLRGLSS